MEREETNTSDTEAVTRQVTATKRSRSPQTSGTTPPSQKAKIPTPPPSPNKILSDGFVFPKHTARAVENQTSIPTPVSNSFSTLPIEELTAESTSSPEPPVPEPTPTQNNPTPLPASRPRIGTIFISTTDILDGKELIHELQKCTSEKIQARYTKDNLIITPKSVLAHQKLTSRLHDLKTTPSLRELFFTAPPNYHYHRATPETREKLILKGLPPKQDTADMIQEIQSQNFTCFHLSEMIRHNPDKSTTNLGIYVMEVPKNQIPLIKSNLRYLCLHRVTIDSYKPNNRIPRCTNCQLFNHTRSYCHRTPTCCYCAQPHSTDNCTNLSLQDFKPTCANCKNQHPANDPQCPTLIQHQQQRATNLQRIQTLRQSLPSNNTANLQQSSFPSLPSRSFAQAVTTPTPSSQNPTPSTSESSSTFTDLKELFTLIKTCNLPKLLQTIKEIITIFKSPVDILSKLISAGTKLCELF